MPLFTGRVQSAAPPGHDAPDAPRARADRPRDAGVAPVPFHVASEVGRESEYVARAVASGRLAGNEAFGGRCQALLEAALGTPRVLLTTSGTHALEMAALLLGVRPGDEVIVPAFTYVSTAGAFALHGAKPVFADVLPDTLNLDPAAVAAAVTPRTKAVVPVHYAGVACDLDRIKAAAGGVPVVEDGAHALFGRLDGRMLGTVGALGAFSFHGTKNFTCGEGGALAVNDPALADRAEFVWEKGTDRSRFRRGEVDQYTWQTPGSSYAMSELLAAFLCGQLERADAVQARRRVLWTRYHDELRDWANRAGARLPGVPAGCDPAFHLFYLVLPSPRARRRLADHLAAAGIQATTHYPPLHLSAMGRAFGGRPGQCPVTEAVCDRLLRLPVYNTLSDADQGRVIRAVSSAPLA